MAKDELYRTRRVTFTATVTISDYGLSEARAVSTVNDIATLGMMALRRYDMGGELEFLDVTANKEISAEEI